MLNPLVTLEHMLICSELNARPSQRYNERCRPSEVDWRVERVNGPPQFFRFCVANFSSSRNFTAAQQQQRQILKRFGWEKLSFRKRKNFTALGSVLERATGRKVYNLARFTPPSFLLSKIIVSIAPTPYLPLLPPLSRSTHLLFWSALPLASQRLTSLASPHSRHSNRSLQPSIRSISLTLVPIAHPRSSSPSASAALRNHLIKSISDSTCSIACHLIQSSR